MCEEDRGVTLNLYMVTRELIMMMLTSRSECRGGGRRDELDASSDIGSVGSSLSLSVSTMCSSSREISVLSSHFTPREFRITSPFSSLALSRHTEKIEQHSQFTTNPPWTSHHIPLILLRPLLWWQKQY